MSLINLSKLFASTTMVVVMSAGASHALSFKHAHAKGSKVGPAAESRQSAKQKHRELEEKNKRVLKRMEEIAEYRLEQGEYVDRTLDSDDEDQPTTKEFAKAMFDRKDLAEFEGKWDDFLKKYKKMYKKQGKAETFHVRDFIRENFATQPKPFVESLKKWVIYRAPPQKDEDVLKEILVEMDSEKDDDDDSWNVGSVLRMQLKSEMETLAPLQEDIDELNRKINKKRKFLHAAYVWSFETSGRKGDLVELTHELWWKKQNLAHTVASYRALLDLNDDVVAEIHANVAKLSGKRKTDSPFLQLVDKVQQKIEKEKTGMHLFLEQLRSGYGSQGSKLSLPSAGTDPLADYLFSGH